MEYLIWPILAIIFFKIAEEVLKNKRQKGRVVKDSDASRAYRAKDLLTKNETSFYRELKKVADKEGLFICPKVGLKDIFEITDRQNYMSWFGKIAQKHVDFLLCDELLRPQYAIELDDNSHKKRADSDNLKNVIFGSSTIPLIRIKAKMEYNEFDIKPLLDVIYPSVGDGDSSLDNTSKASARRTKFEGGI